MVHPVDLILGQDFRQARVELPSDRGHGRMLFDNDPAPMLVLFAVRRRRRAVRQRDKQRGRNGEIETTLAGSAMRRLDFLRA